jgi:hypothetical protein
MRRVEQNAHGLELIYLKALKERDLKVSYWAF